MTHSKRHDDSAAGIRPERPEAELDPLVARAKEGDSRAFGELFTKNSPWVYARLRRMLGPSADTEDLVQEVFLRAHRSLPTFRGQARFETWLRRICARVAYDQMRSGASRPPLVLVTDEPASPRGDDFEAREAARHLQRVVEQLPPKNRLVLILHDVEGHTAEEIQRIVGARSVNTVKSRLRLARAELHRRARGVPALSWIYGAEGGES